MEITNDSLKRLAKFVLVQADKWNVQGYRISRLDAIIDFSMDLDIILKGNKVELSREQAIFFLKVIDLFLEKRGLTMTDLAIMECDDLIESTYGPI
jgi:hypothetical protein